MNRFCYGLYALPMMWRDITKVSSRAVCMILASGFYDKRGYYLDHDQFIEEANASI